jgi:hypothetical protein
MYAKSYFVGIYHTPYPGIDELVGEEFSGTVGKDRFELHRAGSGVDLVVYGGEFTGCQFLA